MSWALNPTIIIIIIIINRVSIYCANNVLYLHVCFFRYWDDDKDQNGNDFLILRTEIGAKSN